MIRSSKLSIKFANEHRKQDLLCFLAEQRRVISEFIGILWDEPKIPTLLPKETTSKVSSWLSARAMQAAGKQASAIVRGTQQKQKQRLFVIKKLMKEGKNPVRLQRIYDRTQTSMPKPENIEVELDSRFVKVNMKNDTSFDIWMELRSLGNKMKIDLPLKKSNHFVLWEKQGEMLKGVRLSNSKATFMFEIPDVPKKDNGNTLGLDIGEITVVTTSDGQASKKDIHGWTLNRITEKLARQKKDSGAFGKTQRHRTNYINWTINQLDLSNTKELKIEDITKLRYKRRSSRRLSHWTYTEIFGKLERLCEETGVQLLKVSPTYTSQRCSKCGWVRKANRKGKLFSCNRCGYRTDADLNASRNLELTLPGIPKAIRLKRLNLSGFYWMPEGLFSGDGTEPIVPCTQKT